jgi:hypothetical protein
MPSPSVLGLWHRVAESVDLAPSSGRSPEPQPAQVAAPFVPPPLPKATPFPDFATLRPSAEQSEAKARLEHGDWLDNALAEFDSTIAQTSHPGHPEPAAAAGLHANLHQDEVVPPALAAKPAQADHPPVTDAEPAPGEPAVIGRYDAEGTCYIMYADGSIEAQSDQGVARFSSMADLKAYFETQEVP